MSWAVGYDVTWGRDIGYGVPAVCDYPGCNEEIDRGLSYVCCGEQPYGGDKGCGLYFCGKHANLRHMCERCESGGKPFDPKPDTPEWIRHKETDPSWAEWRKQRDQIKRRAVRGRYGAVVVSENSAPDCWAVIAYRWGWLNSHQYIVRVTNDLQSACEAADSEAQDRGGKYGVTVWDKDGAPVYHAPSCYGETKAHTNDRMRLFEQVGLYVVVALEDGKPLDADEIKGRWRQELEMQQIMERADK